MCYSNEIASLEWPIVFHIQYTDLEASRDTLFLEADQCLIISRCMVHYFHICQNSYVTEAPVSNRSFQTFYKWYNDQYPQNRRKRHDSGKASYGDAFKEY